MQKESLVRRAADEYRRGNYQIALGLYRQLSNQLGEKIFQANIWLCEKRLKSLERKSCTQSPLKSIKVACVMDEFTLQCYEPECNLLSLTPDNVLDELDKFNPDLLFIESAWRGKDGLWNHKIGALSKELRSALQWCKDRGVPTVFWNKEDPVHFETFLTTAQQFDYVFTTDIDCIARYKAALGHERVFFLPFACQPKVHNPVDVYDRKNAFCFAGAYYVRYPERTRDLENFVAELTQYLPLEIFDRNYGKDDVNYQFPPAYQPFIVGTVPFDQIDKAYKGYRYAINLNSIKQSQTMFARRVYELLASNTITVSNFSRGVRLLFGDLVIATDSGKEIVDRLQRLDAETEQKLRLAGLRKVMLEHTYENRLAYVVSKALGRHHLASAMPTMVVVAMGRTADECRRIVENFSRQTYVSKKLIIITETKNSLQNLAKAILDETTVIGIADAKTAQIHELIQNGEWLVSMVPQDYYGPNYLLDLAIATRYSDATVLGKVARYCWNKDRITLIYPDQAYRPATGFAMRSCAIRSDAVESDSSLLSWVEGLEKNTCSQPGLAIDPFNYCQDGLRSGDLKEISKRVDDLALDSGMSIDELIQIAENIAPLRLDEFDLPKWTAAELFRLNASSRPQIQFEMGPGGLTIRSTLPDGKHEYLYVREELPINKLPAGKELKTNLEVTPGLDIEYVFLFLNEKRQKISHAIFKANRNETALVPEGTAIVRFGYRVKGTGSATIKHLFWGHRKHEPAVLLGRSETLLLTNHYPQYDDLYRNGFVHSRVRAYLERGVKVDVFRLRVNDSTRFHEFQNIDVITGDQGALHKLLSSGRYKSVLVHFLSPEMWEVLAHYPHLKKIVWVHGAEIQPWHRREYNFQSDQERAKAVLDSDRRMAFWRRLLNPMPPNLKLVFVSRYFAEEVFEDLGFRLSEDNYVVIHNPIDTDLFSYQPKHVDQRKRVLSIRPYASRKYANDLSVKAILKLADKPYFQDMEFRLIGDGKLFEETLSPLRKFSNVIIERRFLTQPEIAALHKEYGVFLVPTRMDAQGVSRDEAMSSGLVPVTNAVAAIPEFVDETCGVLAGPEDADGLAAGLEKLYRSPELFSLLSQAAANRVRSQSDKNRIIALELGLFNGD